MRSIGVSRIHSIHPRNKSLGFLGGGVKTSLAIIEEDLKRLEELLKGCDYDPKHDIPIESRKRDCGYERMSH